MYKDMYISTCSMSNDCHDIVSSGSSGATIEIVTSQIPKCKISFVAITICTAISDIQ